ncbi:MAG: hypothetical protein K2J82_00475 [Muribaculaceae bacterium]|nr:hypothetical protein [Muribaculaceae bacterium]
MMTTLRSGSKVAIAASSFSIYAFQELKEQLSDISELRFIFTSPSFITEKTDKQKREFYIPRLNRERDLYGSEFEINYKNNPLVADRLRYDILYHTDLSRQSGQSNGLDLEHINWGNYDLVVIDESHNFRNGGKVTTDENDENPRDDYINLKGRVEARMKVSVLTATGDDNPLTIEEQGDLKYRRDQLERLKEEVVDIEEMSSGVSIMDLGLNEFRLDLLEYMRSGVDIEHTPMGLHALTSASKDAPQGVIFVLKNRNNDINIDKKNRLHPFYMVYISKESEVLVNHLDPKGMLDRMRQLCRGKSEPIPDLCRRFNAETRDGQRMGTYSRLLGDAISSLIKVKEASDLFSFLDGDSGSLFGNEVKGLDDFELICFLMIR